MGIFVDTAMAEMFLFYFYYFSVCSFGEHDGVVIIILSICWNNQSLLSIKILEWFCHSWYCNTQIYTRLVYKHLLNPWLIIFRIKFRRLDIFYVIYVDINCKCFQKQLDAGCILRVALKSLDAFYITGFSFGISPSLWF